MNTDNVPVLICDDCQEVLINGGTENKDWPGMMPWVGEYNINPSDDKEPTFGRFPCDTCGTHQAGYRWETAAMPTV